MSRAFVVLIAVLLLVSCTGQPPAAPATMTPAAVAPTPPPAATAGLRFYEFYSPL